MLGNIEPMQVDGPEENENEAGTEETEVGFDGVYVGESRDNLQQEQNYLVENPSLDLELTSNAFTGLAKLSRLQFIAEHCPVYTVEALKLAIK